MDSKSFDSALWSLSPIDCPSSTEPLVGLLSFDADQGVQLEIPVGSLIDNELGDSAGRSKTEAVEAIYGYSTTGKYYLLERAARTGSQVTYPGMRSERYCADSLMVSRTPLCPNPKVKSMALYFEGLREWVGMQPVQSTMKLDKDSGILQSYSFEYDVERVVEPVIFENDDICIQVRHVWRQSGGPVPQYEHKFSTEYHIEFALKRGEMRLQELLDSWVFSMRNFLNFCMGFRSEVTRLVFATNDTRGCELYMRIIGSPLNEKNWASVKMPLPYRTVESRLNDMADKWLGFTGYAEHASQSFVSLLGVWEMPLNLEFFASAVVLEALSHDVPSEGDQKVLLVDRGVLEEVKNSELSQDTKEAVIEELYRPQNSNDLTDRLLDELGEYVEYVIPDLNQFKKDHRDARNGHAHLNPKKLKKAPKLSDLYTHTKAVQLLSYGALCMRLGLSAAEVLDAMRESRFMSSHVWRSRELYARKTRGKDRATVSEE